MATAAGAGNKIDKGYLAVPAFARVYAQVQPIADPLDPGRVDTDGRELHVRYTGNLNLRARSGQVPNPVANQVNAPLTAPTVIPADFVPNTIVVEFDAVSSFTVPFDGMIELVGGLGQWKFGLGLLEVMDPQFYTPKMRTLKTYLIRRGVTFTVPNFHTFLLGIDPSNSFELPGGTKCSPGVVLPGISVTAGWEITNLGGSATWVLTGWEG